MSFLPILEDQNPWWKEPAHRSSPRYRVRRDLQPVVLTHLLRLDDRRALVLLGPRQVGKTVLLRQLADDLLDAELSPGNLTYFDFSDDRLTGKVTPREVADTRPVAFAPDQPRVLLLDEVGRAGDWALWLKQAVDAGGARIVVTDSAASLLRDGTRESGQGRWDEHHLEGLSFREFLRLQAGPEETAEQVLRRAPNLHERYLALGGFPEHARSDDFPEVRRRLRGDIADRAVLRDLATAGVDVQRVRDLFVYLIQDSGAELNAESRGNDLKADPRSIRDWVRLLADTLLIAPLDRRTRQAAAALRSRTRLYAADHGLIAAFAAAAPGDERVRARVFEAVVFRHLREAARQLEAELTYFRQDEEREIDFVLEGGGVTVGIEVTSSARLRPEKIEKVRRAGALLGADRLLLVHGGLVEEPGDRVQPVPLARFLLDPIVALGGVRR
ncbi:MAG TPA: ATP-binding protein [Thermoanaerobaculia bacterium]|jgi:predicted AAA+ superfamily ATPase|nr:ATP-binding protein [Thermoanaerobaculia bacterium]